MNEKTEKGEAEKVVDQLFGMLYNQLPPEVWKEIMPKFKLTAKAMDERKAAKAKESK